MLKYDGIGQVVITALAEAAEGDPVMVVGPDFWASGEDGSEIGGVCIHNKDGLASVAISGIVTLPYTGDAPGYGFVGLLCNGASGVKTGDSACSRAIIKVDEEAKKVTFIL